MKATPRPGGNEDVHDVDPSDHPVAHQVLQAQTVLKSSTVSIISSYSVSTSFRCSRKSELAFFMENAGQVFRMSSMRAEVLSKRVESRYFRYNMEKFAGQPIDTLADARRFVPTFLLFIVKLPRFFLVL